MPIYLERRQTRGLPVTNPTKEWTAPIYAFFWPVPLVENHEGRRCHTFMCAAKECLYKSRGVHRFLDKGDAKSTSNMQKHAKKCWGNDIIRSADKANNANEAHRTTIKGALNLQLIMAAFERKGKGKVTYSHCQHTKTESWAEKVRWVAESKRPFKIVEDRGFQSLMKTGRPEYHILCVTTISQDVKKVFVNICRQMAKMLQEHKGNINFAMDAWTSPNHKVFVAIMVHFEVNGAPMCILLDLVEVAESHSGLNLAAMFARVLDKFGVSEKVSNQNGQ
jgi:hypothetical protein